MIDQPTNPFPQQEHQTPQQKPAMQTLQIIEGGLFEVIFVSVCLSILFGLLNYFNVINLSKIYPPLAALPQQHSALTPLPTTPRFIYDMNAANTNIKQFTAETLLGKYTGNISANLTESDNIFTAKEALSTDTTVEIKEINKHMSNDYDYLQLALTTASASATSSNATASATMLLASFFKPFADTTPLSCTLSTKGEVCEQFASTIYGDVGQGVIIESENMYLLFRCNIPINSSMRFVKKSCLPLL